MHQFHRVFEEPFHLFLAFAVDFSDLHQQSQRQPCDGKNISRPTRSAFNAS
jgi:hypothetical protein